MKTKNGILSIVIISILLSIIFLQFNTNRRLKQCVSKTECRIENMMHQKYRIEKYMWKKEEEIDSLRLEIHALKSLIEFQKMIPNHDVYLMLGQSNGKY